MFDTLKQINSRPEPFQFYTADDLWTDEHTSEQMLEYHLNESVDMSSRNKAFIDRSAEWIAGRFDLGPNAHVADFGCGPGLYTTRLAQKGARLVGIDFSKRSIQYAKNTALENGLDIEYINQNYLEFEAEKRFDLILMIMCDFCALSPEQRKVMVEKFRGMLNPGGVVLLDVYSYNAFDQREEASTYELNQLNGFWSSEDYYGFLNTFKYPREKVILDKYTIIDPTRTRVIYNWLQYFSRESIRKEFEDNGFTVREIYSDVAGAPYAGDTLEMAIEATIS